MEISNGREVVPTVGISFFAALHIFVEQKELLSKPAPWVDEEGQVYHSCHNGPWWYVGVRFMCLIAKHTQITMNSRMLSFRSFNMSQLKAFKNSRS